MRLNCRGNPLWLLILRAVPASAGGPPLHLFEFPLTPALSPGFGGDGEREGAGKVRNVQTNKARLMVFLLLTVATGIAYPLLVTGIARVRRLPGKMMGMKSEPPARSSSPRLMTQIFLGTPFGNA